jgi:hypothetical protein
MSEKLLTPIEIGLTAAIVALEGNEPLILTASSSDNSRLAGLPFGPFDAVAHRTFEIGLRAWVEEQAGLRLGYVEQLYTFGDRGRHTLAGDTEAHVASIGYLALTRTADNAAPAPGATFEPWYKFFPWEDWRQNRPEIIEREILPELNRWAAQSETPETARALARKDGRRVLGRGARARPLRTALRGWTGRGGTARRSACGAGAQIAARARHLHALRSPSDSRNRDRAAARQAEISPRRL